MIKTNWNFQYLSYYWMYFIQTSNTSLYWQATEVWIITWHCHLYFQNYATFYLTKFIKTHILTFMILFQDNFHSPLIFTHHHISVVCKCYHYCCCKCFVSMQPHPTVVFSVHKCLYLHLYYKNTSICDSHNTASFHYTTCQFSY